MSLSHIKTRHGYDFLLYFPHQFLKSFLRAFRSLTATCLKLNNKCIKLRKTQLILWLKTCLALRLRMAKLVVYSYHTTLEEYNATVFKSI